LADHPATERLEGYRARTLGAADLLAVDDHVAACEACRRRLAEEGLDTAFAALPSDDAIALERDLTELLNRMNRGGIGSLVVPSEYVEVIVTRR
jgi:transposase